MSVMNETNPPRAASLDNALDGVLIIDKPAGITSHDVVARVRKLLKTRRVGHTGTLDPFATGVLVICVNRATRLARFLTGDDKEYLATMRLGFATDTGDLTGRPVSPPVSPVVDARHIATESVREALNHFRGRIRQTPPMYSAKKVGGVKLHEMARRGEEIERAPVEVEIKEIELCGASEVAENMTKDISFRVVCSSGTYVRTLAEDIGKRLGIGAHLTRLRRTRAGQCDIAQALTLEQLAETSEKDWVLIPMPDVLPFPELSLNEEERKAVAYGRSIRRRGDWRHGDLAKLVDSSRALIAIAEFDPEKLVWRPIVVLGVDSAV
jgi:tRNA pseudouridine55 synthase